LLTAVRAGANDRSLMEASRPHFAAGVAPRVDSEVKTHGKSDAGRRVSHLYRYRSGCNVRFNEIIGTLQLS
jgi:hypothetical protein